MKKNLFFVAILAVLIAGIATTATAGGTYYSSQPMNAPAWMDIGFVPVFDGAQVMQLSDADDPPPPPPPPPDKGGERVEEITWDALKALYA